MGMLQDRVAIVTGGASGIGRAVATHFAREGARVCVADINATGAEAVAKEIAEQGGDAFGFTIDTSDERQNEAMVSATVERYGGLHAAHLNAGIAVGSTILEGSVDDWDRVVAINLRGVFLGMRAIAPAMIRGGGGSIIATASVAGLRGSAGMPSYYASKHGVVGLVKAAAMEFAEHGIRVNAVCPGVIDTPILGPVHKMKEFTEGPLADFHPLGRVGQPEEVAELVGFLASDHSSFMTGVPVPIDGGITAGFGGSRSTGDEEDADRMRQFMEKIGSE